MAVLQATMSAKSEQKPREIEKPKENQSTKPAKEVLLIAQDVKFARALAANEKKFRDRALKRLKKWFQQRYEAHPFTQEDFKRIWKGLFYSMWMSDKPLIQEECAENIAQLVHFPDADTSLLFFKCGLEILMEEWFGIDQLRLDKFMMFTRRLLRQGLVVLRNARWKQDAVNRFGEVLIETVLKRNAGNVLGLRLHFIDIYLEELAKVSEGHIKRSTVSQLILPFIKYLAYLDDGREIHHTKKNIFHYLMKQSEKGLEFDERFEAWKKTNFAGGSINSMVKQYVPPEERIPVEESSETEKKDKPLDPRAGHVNVELPLIKFNSKEIVKLLEEYRFVKESSKKSRKAIANLIKQFTDLSKGKYPLGMKKIKLPKDDNYSINLKDSVNRLMKFEQKLMAKDKKPKKRKRNSENDLEVPKKKQKKSRESVADGEDYDLFARKLEEFVENSEGKNMKKLKKTKKALVEDDDDDDVDLSNCETVFRRNSGTWYVTEENVEEKPSLTSPKVEINNEDEAEIEVEEEQKEDDDEIEEEDEIEIEEGDEEDDEEEVVQNNVSVKKRQQIYDSSSDEEDIENFDATEYYNSLLRAEQNAIEEEYMTPKDKKLQRINEELVQNPFSKPQTPASSKKVKIALNLNQSQEFHEHEMQILKSPAIPFDTNKKPTKPLLKPSPIASPINPFYRKKKLFGTSF